MKDVATCHLCASEYEEWWSDEWNMVVPEDLKDKEICISCFEKAIGRECVIIQNIGGMEAIGTRRRYSIFVKVKE